MEEKGQKRRQHHHDHVAISGRVARSVSYGMRGMGETLMPKMEFLLSCGEVCITIGGQ